jgi:hypothetical protein
MSAALVSAPSQGTGPLSPPRRSTYYWGRTLTPPFSGHSISFPALTERKISFMIHALHSLHPLHGVLGAKVDFICDELVAGDIGIDYYLVAYFQILHRDR